MEGCQKSLSHQSVTYHVKCPGGGLLYTFQASHLFNAHLLDRKVTFFCLDVVYKFSYLFTNRPHVLAPILSLQTRVQDLSATVRASYASTKAKHRFHEPPVVVVYSHFIELTTCHRLTRSEKKTWVDIGISLFAVPKRQPRGSSLQPQREFINQMDTVTFSVTITHIFSNLTF